MNNQFLAEEISKRESQVMNRNKMIKYLQDEHQERGKEILELKDKLSRRNMQIKELKKRINDLTPCWQHRFTCENCQYMGDCADQNKLNR